MQFRGVIPKIVKKIYLSKISIFALPGAGFIQIIEWNKNSILKNNGPFFALLLRVVKSRIQLKKQINMLLQLG